MRILLKNGLIKDANSPYFEMEKDIFIEDGRIKKIADTIQEQNDRVIECRGKWVVPSFIDMSAHLNDPGMEHKEDITSGLRAAIEGGFSQVCVLPNTIPVSDSKGQMEYLISRSSKEIADILPYGAVSVGARGEQMAEMMDLFHSGAVAFTDGLNSIVNSELLFKALQYVHKFDGLIINRPCDPYLSTFGQMHEGIKSTELGMRGIPSLAEKLMIQRDLSILEYAGGRMHFSCISSKEGVELIGKAKKNGLDVTCDVAIHNLLWTDEMMEEFNTNYKVNPPLRSEEDRKTLIEGLKSGIIDCIVSDHQPQDEENKKLEFDLAAFGMTSLQTVFSGLIYLKAELPLNIAITALTHNPRKILRVSEYSILEGAEASISIFDSEEKWTLDLESNHSKSINTPYFGKELTGKVIGMYHLGALYLNENV